MLAHLYLISFQFCFLYFSPATLVLLFAECETSRASFCVMLTYFLLDFMSETVIASSNSAQLFPNSMINCNQVLITFAHSKEGYTTKRILQYSMQWQHLM